ncbi:MAG: integrin alpha, partial [Dehalococcoidia bacterium]
MSFFDRKIALPGPATLLAILALSVVAISCGGDDGPSPSPSETPPSATPPAETPTQPPVSPSEDNVLDLAFDPPLTTIWGSDTGDYFNDLPLLTSADVNGDGKDDLLIGARFGDGPNNSRPDSGEAYVVYGSDPLPATIDLANGEADVTIFAAEPDDQLGYSGTLADVNGDGLPDVIIGAPFANRGVGAVYVIFGGPGLPSVIDLATTPANVTLKGAQGNSFFGDAIASTDANGDGVADIIVGATFIRRPADMINPNAQAGAAYVFFGSPSLAAERDTADGDFDVVIYGENSDPHPDELGDNVFGADLNNDGIGDLILTAEAADGPNNERSVGAEVHIVFGSEDLGGVIDVALDEQDVTVIGADPNDTLGFGLSAGDVNNDGIDDLLASARGADGPGNSSSELGELHIVLGGALP